MVKRITFRRTVLLLLLTIIAGVGVAQAQTKNRKRGGDSNWFKEMTEFKLKFLAQELELTEDQQKKFFPIYTEMMNAKHNVMCKARQAENRLKGIANPTDEDYRIASEAMDEAHREDEAIEKRYEAKFRTILSPKQMYKLKQAERKFHERLREMRHKKKKK